MKIVVASTPIRPVPTNFPPFGVMTVISSLRRAGYDPLFYDIDGLRPTPEEVERFFSEHRPDILGISAVVSTSYSYTKWLARTVKRVSPGTLIVLGGNLAASAEILHRCAGVDLCVVGEGEIVAVNLVDHLRERSASGKGEPDWDALGRIPGLTFIGPDGHMVFTGYERPVPPDRMLVPDFTILEKHSRMENFILDPLCRPDFAQDERTHQPRRRGQKLAQILTSKGCVSRCTFCHRWDKGYRVFPIENVVRAIRTLRERHNVGFIQFGDENFGAHRKHVDALVEALKALDILYVVTGVRCRSVDPGLLRRMKESGCTAIYYGMETGSAHMLEIMEKKTDLEHNQNAVRWTAESGLHTVYQIILGMPGENEETIRENTEFFKRATEVLSTPPINRMSINFIHTLPGTPVYEYARRKGLIGDSLEDEERYLERISDVEANDDTKFINYTPYDYLTVQSWRRRITLDCTKNYMRKGKLPPPSLSEMYRQVVLRALRPAAYERLRKEEEEKRGGRRDFGGYFNMRSSIIYAIVAAYLYPLRTPVLWVWVVTRAFQRLGTRATLRHVRDAVLTRLRLRRTEPPEYRSIRKMVRDLPFKPRTRSEEAMQPLRDGR